MTKNDKIKLLRDACEEVTRELECLCDDLPEGEAYCCVCECDRALKITKD